MKNWKRYSTPKQVAKTIIVTAIAIIGTSAFIFIIGEPTGDSLWQFFTQKLLGILLAGVTILAGQVVHRRNLSPLWWKEYQNWILTLGEEEE